jgi:hypothetical protein
VSCLGEHQEVFVSVLTKKQPTSDSSALRAQAAYAALASKTVPLAQQAALQAQLAAQQARPLARTAGTSMRQGADGAVAWATPRVDAARSWAAPQLEQTAHAISDSLAPMISGALISAAQKIDAPVREKPHRRRGMIAGVLLLVATIGAGAALAMRLRQEPTEFSAAPMTDDKGPPDPDMNGHSQIV